MTMYSDTAQRSLDQAVSRSMRSRLSKVSAEIPEAELLRIEEHARKTWLPIAAGLHLDEKEIAEVMGLVIYILIEQHAGRITQAKVDTWCQHVYNDMYAAGLTPKQAGAKLDALKERLHIERPDVEMALDQAYPVGYHTRVQRMLMRWHDKRTADDAFKERSKAGRMAPAGGSTLPGSGRIGAVALRSLGRSPLGGDPDAA